MDLTKEPDWAWFRGRTVLITGGANGLGHGMVKQWAKHGCVDWSIVDISHERAVLTLMRHDH